MQALVLFFLCSVVFVSGLKDPVAAGVQLVSPAQCSDGSTFNREQAWLCIENVVDTNNDKRISAEEIEQAEYVYIPAWKRWALKALSYVVEAMRVSHIITACDSDGDGYITLDDYGSKHGKGWCMPYMDPDTQWTEVSPGLCYMKQFCDNAATILGKRVY